MEIDMREIKFRAWNKYMGQNGMMFLNHTFLSISKTGIANLPELIWMQYTGLKDKNGKEIYEGDLLHNPHDQNYCYEIVWNEDKAGFGLDADDENLKPYQVHDFWEVIGNIYENPELRRQLNDPSV